MSVSDFRTESIVELVTWVVVVAIVILAGVLLFTPYEAFVEGFAALLIVAAVVAGFLMYPRKEVFYVRTSVRLVDPDRKQTLEKDFLAVRVELARLWLLFLPTLLAVACLVFFAAGGSARFSLLNWLFVSPLAFFVLMFWVYAGLFVLLLLSSWLSERRVMRDAEACSARYLSNQHDVRRPIGRVGYLFMGEGGEYYGGYSWNFGRIHSRELATIVFHNARKPEINKIAMGFLFHSVVILGRGIKDLDDDTVVIHKALAETPSLS